MTQQEFLEFLAQPIGAFIIAVFVLWTVVWKGLALYRAGANRSPIWFVFLLVLNTLGILEILYLLFFSRRRKREVDARLGVL